VSEAVAALHYLDQAALDNIGSIEPVDPRPVERHRAFGYLAALGSQQVRDRLETRRFAGAVSAEQRDDPALRDSQRDAFKHQNDMVIDNLDIVDCEQRSRRSRRFNVHGGNRRRPLSGPSPVATG
jgi:hypothetical protein